MAAGAHGSSCHRRRTNRRRRGRRISILPAAITVLVCCVWAQAGTGQPTKPAKSQPTSRPSTQPARISEPAKPTSQPATWPASKPSHTSGGKDKGANPADEAGDDELLLFEDMPVVISASRQPQSADWLSVPVSIITAEDIHYSGHTNLPEILQYTPGVDVLRIDRNRYAVGVRGLHDVYSDRTLVLIDGRNAYSPLVRRSRLARPSTVRRRYRANGSHSRTGRDGLGGQRLQRCHQHHN